MAGPEEAMYKEAMAAVQAGDRSRARDLFTRLLKINQNQAEYWLWMSAVVETRRERLYCLQEVLKRDPKNISARRGMQILGIAGPDETAIIPAKFQQRNWEAAVLGSDNPEKALAARSLRLTLGVAAGLVVLTALIVVGILAARKPRYEVVYVTPDLSEKASPTYLPTNSPVVRSPTVTFTGPTPLWMQMEATYTPTPLYVSTPHSAEAFSIAMRAYARGDWAGVEEYIGQAATLQPDQPDLLYYAGEANRFQEQNTAAMGYYNQAISANPAFAPAYLGRARVRLAEDPTAREAPLEDLDRAIELDPNLGEAYLEKAALFIADRRYNEALILLEAAAGLLPGSPWVAYQRGQALLRLERYPEALDVAQRANQLDVTLLPAYRLLGEALLANDEGAQAVQPLLVYTTYEQKDAYAYVLLGRAYEAAEENPKAFQAFNQALALDRGLVEALLRRGDLSYRAGEFEAAAEDFERADALDGKRYDIALRLGKTYLGLGAFGDAYMAVERANGLSENERQKAEALFWRAQALEKLNEIRAALRDYNTLVELPADSVDPQWVDFANERLAALATPTPTVPATVTRTPTRTALPSRSITPTP